MLNRVNVFLMYILICNIPFIVTAFTLQKPIFHINNLRQILLHYFFCITVFYSINFFSNTNVIKDKFIFQIAIVLFSFQIIIEDKALYSKCIFYTYFQYILCELLFYIFSGFSDRLCPQFFFLIIAIYGINVLNLMIHKKLQQTNQKLNDMDLNFYVPALMIVLFEEYILQTISQLDYSNFLTKISFCSVCQILCISFLILKLKLQFNSFSKNIKSLEEYQQTISDVYTTTRIFRHDYKNNLIALKGYVDSEDYKNLGALVNQLYSEMADSYKYNHFTGLEKITDPGIKYLLYNKLLSAQKKNVECTFNLNGIPTYNHMKKIHIISLLGNILDNAIDAASKASQKSITISLSFIPKYTEIKISNTCIKCPDVQSIFKKNYSTKKSHDGLGLYKVKKILRKYNADYCISVENNYFILKLIIYN